MIIIFYKLCEKKKKMTALIYVNRKFESNEKFITEISKTTFLE